MEGEEALFTALTARSLVILALGAFAIPLLCKPLRLPAAVGEILFGLAVGPHAWGFVSGSDFIRLLGHVGFFLLMFIAGLELDFRQVEKEGLRRLGRHGLTVALMFGAAFGLAALAGLPPFGGMILSAISIGVPLVLLQETGQSRAAFGQRILLVGSLGEFSSIVLATGLSAWSHAEGFNARFLGELSQLILVFLTAYLILVVLRTAVWWKSESFARVVETHDPSEIGVRAGLALMFAMVAVTAALRIEPILGAFMAGALFSFAFRHRGPLEVKFLSLGNGFFIPFFFITVGLDFDLGLALQGDMGLFLTLLALLFASRFLALAATWTREPRGLRWATAGALVLSAPLTLLLVLGNLGLHLGLIDRAFHATLILLAVVSSTLYPFLFKMAARGLPPGAP